MAVSPAPPIRTGRRTHKTPSWPPRQRAWSIEEETAKPPHSRITCISNSETFIDPDPDSEVASLSKSDSDSDSYSDSVVALESDPEGEYLLKRIAHHKGLGRAKSRRSDWSKKLIRREVEHWREQVFARYTLISFHC